MNYSLASDEAVKGKMPSKSSLRTSRFYTQQVFLSPWCFCGNYSSPVCHTVLFVFEGCAWSEQSLMMEEGGERKNTSNNTGLKLGTETAFFLHIGEPEVFVCPKLSTIKTFI